MPAFCGWIRTRPPVRTPTRRCWPSLRGRVRHPAWHPNGGQRALTLKRSRWWVFLGIDSLLFGQGFRAYEACSALITPGRGEGAAAEGRTARPGADPDLRTGPPGSAASAAQDYEGLLREEIPPSWVWSLPLRSARLWSSALSATRRIPGVHQPAQRFGALLAPARRAKANIHCGSWALRQ